MEASEVIVSQHVQHVEPRGGRATAAEEHVSQLRPYQHTTGDDVVNRKLSGCLEAENTVKEKQRRERHKALSSPTEGEDRETEIWCKGDVRSYPDDTKTQASSEPEPSTTASTELIEGSPDDREDCCQPLSTHLAPCNRAGEPIWHQHGISITLELQHHILPQTVALVPKAAGVNGGPAHGCWEPVIHSFCRPHPQRRRRERGRDMELNAFALLIKSCCGNEHEPPATTTLLLSAPCPSAPALFSRNHNIRAKNRRESRG
ncbi:unnamed protein product [Pleuronectes platessa]|uniref:Uncharacterized protein n=1 Tax=Pleuronectes platessa TaxID=8262 RepID=A0A9N7U3N0_PLEPL|nr:unnamed protein product [Pleuronectes platessa]